MGLATDLREGLAETINNETADDVEVYQSHPNPLRLARGRWVSVADIRCDIDADTFRGSSGGVLRWMANWNIAVAAGSGRQFTSPAEAEDAAWDLAEQVCVAVADDPKVGVDNEHLLGVLPSSIERMVAWDDDTDYRQVVMLVTLEARSRGIGRQT